MKHAYYILLNLDWIGLVSIASFLIFIMLYLLGVKEPDNTNLEFELKLKNKTPKNLTFDNLKKYFPNNKFLKETNLTLNDNIHDFLKGFLESEGCINKEDKN